MPNPAFASNKRDFLVVAKPGHNMSKIRMPHGASVTHSYQDTLNGYAVSMTRDDAAKLRGDPRVEAVIEKGHRFHRASRGPQTASVAELWANRPSNS